MDINWEFFRAKKKTYMSGDALSVINATDYAILRRIDRLCIVRMMFAAFIAIVMFKYECITIISVEILGLDLKII